MGSNGNTPKLRVLLTGPAADRLAPTLERRTRDLDGRAPGADDSSRADVALHVVASSSDPNVAEEVRRAPRGRRRAADPGRVRRAERDRRDRPRRRRGRRADPAPADRDAAVRAPQGCDRPGGDRGRQGRDRLLAEGRKRQDRAGDEPRRGGRALGPKDAPRRPRPAVRRLRADAGHQPAGDDRRPHRFERRRGRREAAVVHHDRRADGSRRAARAAAPGAGGRSRPGRPRRPFWTLRGTPTTRS